MVWVDLPLFHPLLCTPPPSSLPSHLASSSSSSSSAPASGTSTPSGPSRHNPLASRADDEPGAALVAPTKGTWDHVSEKGLGGLTGAAQRRWRRRRGLPAEDDEDDRVRGERGGPEREVRAFVERKWPEKDGWETAWCVGALSSRSRTRRLSQKTLRARARGARTTLTIASRPQVRQPAGASERARPRPLPCPRTASTARGAGHRACVERHGIESAADEDDVQVEVEDWVDAPSARGSSSGAACHRSSVSSSNYALSRKPRCSMQKEAHRRREESSVRGSRRRLHHAGGETAHLARRRL